MSPENPPIPPHPPESDPKEVMTTIEPVIIDKVENKEIIEASITPEDAALRNEVLERLKSHGEEEQDSEPALKNTAPASKSAAHKHNHGHHNHSKVHQAQNIKLKKKSGFDPKSPIGRVMVWGGTFFKIIGDFFKSLEWNKLGMGGGGGGGGKKAAGGGHGGGGHH